MPKSMSEVVMARMRNLLGVGLGVLMLMSGAVVGGLHAQEPEAAPPQAATDGFIPMSEMANREVLPAAPLVFYAYAFVWIALIAYLWIIWRRVGQVEADVAAVTQRLSTGGRER